MASHSEVAHRWAQDDASARQISGFNMFYERGGSATGNAGTTYGQENVIFSHGRHFPVAAFQTDANGRRVVLFTSNDYSMSTSKHKSHVSRAIPSRYPVFNVPHVSPMHKKGGSDNFHADNLKAYLDQTADLYGKAKRARINGPWYTERAERVLSEARDYAAAFKIKFAIPDTLEGAAAAAAAVAEKQRKAYEKERKAREKRERERMAALRIEQAAEFARWQSGEGWRVPSSYDLDENGSVYVRRYRSEHETGLPEDELQTSRGASAPWRHAVRVFQFVKMCRDTATPWKTNGRVIRVGHFSVDRIDEHGNMWAGCHYFAWERMAELAEREGVFEVEPSAEVVEAR